MARSLPAETGLVNPAIGQVSLPLDLLAALVENLSMDCA